MEKEKGCDDLAWRCDGLVPLRKLTLAITWPHIVMFSIDGLVEAAQVDGGVGQSLIPATGT